MSESRNSAVEPRRLVKASLVVLALVLSLPAIQAVIDTTGGLPEMQATEVGINAHALIGEGDPFAALERVEGAVTVSGDASLPMAFENEIGTLPGARDVRVDDSGTVVGYELSESAEEACSKLVEHMESRGWSSVALGGMEGATFTKSWGDCTWALATCTRMGNETSVVMRCMYL